MDAAVDDGVDVADPLHDLKLRRLTRLEQISLELRRQYIDHTQCVIAEKMAKSELYLSGSKSHAEREGFASAKAVRNVTDTILVMGEIKRLEEERDFLRFVIEHDQ